MGFPMGYIDVGGGLGIDYDGSRTNFESSMNYSMEEYARDVVFNIREICTSAGVRSPPRPLSPASPRLLPRTAAAQRCGRQRAAESHGLDRR